MSPLLQADSLLTELQVKWSEVKSLSHVQLFATAWTVAHQAPPSMGFSRQEYWSGLPFPSPGDLSNPGIESWSPTLQADALTSEPPGKPLNVTISKNLRHEKNSMLQWKVEHYRVWKLHAQKRLEGNRPEYYTSLSLVSLIQISEYFNFSMISRCFLTMGKKSCNLSKRYVAFIQ